VTYLERDRRLVRLLGKHSTLPMRDIIHSAYRPSMRARDSLSNRSINLGKEKQIHFKCALKLNRQLKPR
jgi:hypothetical protein